jgi:hypothetical protein
MNILNLFKVRLLLRFVREAIRIVVFISTTSTLILGLLVLVVLVVSCPCRSLSSRRESHLERSHDRFERCHIKHLRNASCRAFVAIPLDKHAPTICDRLLHSPRLFGYLIRDFCSPPPHLLR